MSGGNCPETPRQKMIGMMYLFLTALMALNISAEVMNAFIEIDESLVKTTDILKIRTEDAYRDIANKAAESQEYEALNKVAQDVERRTNKLVSNINRLKLMIVNTSSGTNHNDLSEINFRSGLKLDDKYAAGTVMIPEVGVRMGDSLRLWMNEYEDFVIGLLKEEDHESGLYEGLRGALGTPDDTESEMPTTWEQKIARGMPMIGTISLLSKLQADVKNSEADILNYLLLELEGGVDIRITSLEGLVSAPKSYVVRGGDYSADIFLGARDSTMDPLVYVRNTAPYWKTEVTSTGDTIYKLLDGDAMQNYDTIHSREGYARYIQPANSVGDMEYGGLIMYKTRKGDEYYPFVGNYTVGDAGFTVAATQCAVLYRGLENPVSVAVSGYPSESVNVSISGGASIRRGRDGYTVTVPQSTPNEVSITVSVRTDEGGRTLGSQKFRVFNVPPPTIYIAGAYRDGATVPRAAIRNSPRLSARLESDFFPFEGITYSINKYEFMFQVRGVTDRITVSSGQITDQVLQQINRMGAGQPLTFTGLEVTGPSGRMRTQGLTVIAQ